MTSMIQEMTGEITSMKQEMTSVKQQIGGELTSMKQDMLSMSVKQGELKPV